MEKKSKKEQDIQCWKCKEYGHKSYDNQCPLKQKSEQRFVKTFSFSYEDPMKDFIESEQRKLKEEKIERVKQLKRLLEESSDSESDESESDSHKRRKKKRIKKSSSSESDELKSPKKRRKEKSPKKKSKKDKTHKNKKKKKKEREKISSDKNEYSYPEKIKYRHKKEKGSLKTDEKSEHLIKTEEKLGRPKSDQSGKISAARSPRSDHKNQSKRNVTDGVVRNSGLRDPEYAGLSREKHDLIEDSKSELKSIKCDDSKQSVNESRSNQIVLKTENRSSDSAFNITQRPRASDFWDD